MKQQALILALALAAVPESALGRGLNDERRLQEDSILDIATASSDLSTLVTALSAAGLVEALGGDGPFTVFAPTDDAFVEAEIDFLLDPEWILHLQSVLLYHVVQGEFLAEDLEAGEEIASIFENEAINVTSVDPVTINGAGVVQADVVASNGVVHIIDQVLFPEFTEVTIAELAAGVPDQFSTLVGLLDAANLTDTLNSDDGAFTVFAPNNDAFAKLDAATLELLASPEGAEMLEEILLFHVVPGIAYASGVQVDDAAITLQGGNITVTSIEPNLVLDGQSTVISADILTRNGVIHIIDTVLMPPSEPENTTEPEDMEGDEEVAEVGEDLDEVTQVGGEVEVTTETETPVVGELNLQSWVFLGEDYSTLFSLLNQSGLEEAMVGPGPLTLFAPTNNAFDDLPDNILKFLGPEWYAHLYDILLYHVVPGVQDTANLTQGIELLTGVGETLTVTAEDPWELNNASTLIDPDNFVSNGIAHGVDSVLLPPSALYHIMDIVQVSPFFAQLNNLIATAGLTAALSGAGPFTIFAPVNNAVASLDPDTAAFLTSADGLSTLQNALRYHVVRGIVLSEDVVPGQKFETFHGCLLTLSQEGEDYFINDAEILDADILTSNGVIHVIDSVLLPSEGCETLPPETEMTAEPVPAPATDPPAPVTDAPEVVDPEEMDPTNTTASVDDEDMPEPENPIEVEDEGTETDGEAGEEGDGSREIPTEETSSALMRGIVSAVAVSAMLPFLLA